MLILIWLLVRVADQKDKKVFLILAMILLSVVAGFRAHSVGKDTTNYDYLFSLIADGHMEQAYGLEESFKYLCFFLLQICNDSTFLFLLFALITNVLVLLRFWDFKHIASLDCMVVCYYIVFYFMTMNIMRQFCAVAIVFYFTRLLPQGKYFKYCAVIAVASLFFHQSALIGIGFLAIEVFNWKSLIRKQKRILILGIFLLPFAGVLVYSIFQNYQHYFSSVSMDIGLMLPLKGAFFVGSLLMSRVVIKSKFKNSEIVRIMLYYFFGLLITSLGYIFAFMDRIGLYFYIFEGVYMGVILKNSSKSNKIFYSACIIVIMGYSFISGLINGSQGVIPYSFVWMT
jgi:hypothetical protein